MYVSHFCFIDYKDDRSYKERDYDSRSSRDKYSNSRSASRYRSPSRDRYDRRDRDRYFTSFRSSRDGQGYRERDRDRDRGKQCLYFVTRQFFMSLDLFFETSITRRF